MFKSYPLGMGDPTRSPPRDKSAGSAFCREVSEKVLETCRKGDPDCILSSVLRDSQGRTVVRVRSGESSSNPLTLLGCLKATWPLAHTAVVENSLDGTVEAQIVVPVNGDELYRAMDKAKRSRVAELMLFATVLLLLTGLIQFALDSFSGKAGNHSHTEL